jgi:putative ABC transport system permease protein
MLRLTLAQMRRSVGRLAAGGVAIAIGSAFVAATLLASGVMTRTTDDSVTARYAHADLVAANGVTDAQLAAIRTVPGVEAADPTPLVGTELRNGAIRVWVSAVPTTSEARREAQDVTRGTRPTAAGQIALPTAIAARLHVTVGDSLVTSGPATTPAATPSPTSGADQVPATVDEQLTVVGLLADPYGAFARVGGAAVVSPPDAVRWGGVTSLTELHSAPVLIGLAPGSDTTAVRAAITAAVPHVTISTKDQAAQATMTQLTNQADFFTGMALAFAAVALVVAALVIANTFQVLLAQRTRTLALLRCVGADRRQLRRSVLVEAAILGASAAGIGLLTGIGLAQIALVVLARMHLAVPLPTTVPMTIWVVLVPFVLGTVVTLLAALVPARAATRVAPIEALRPADAPTIAGRSSRVRLVIATVLTGGGLVALLGGSSLSHGNGAMLGLGVAMLGGTVSFIGILLGAVFWIPRVVSLVGLALARTGPSARIAAANTARNPRRTAATSTALLIGVTLVALMSTGAASAKATLNNVLDDHYPVDLAFAAPPTTDGSAGVMPPGVTATVTSTQGIAAVASLRGTPARITGTGSAGAATVQVNLRGIAPADAGAVVRVPGLTEGLHDGTVVIGPDLASSLRVHAGDQVVVRGLSTSDDAAPPSPGGRPTGLTVVVAGAEMSTAYVTPPTAQRIAPTAPVTEVWARLGDVNDAGVVIPKIQDALTDRAVEMSGPALRRASYQQVIDTLLAVVVGLLAVAVVIALVGVANTLSRSVLERRRESATLRAIGLSRRQLRGMLAIEGMVIAGVGAVLGTGLGMLYGWVGASSLLGQMGTVTLAVPWRDLAMVLGVSLVAGLLASVVPGRSAARTSPVAALAVD